MSITDARRLGAAAGDNTAAGAFQRIEQAVVNFKTRNDASPTEVHEFREEAMRNFALRVEERMDSFTN